MQVVAEEHGVRRIVEHLGSVHDEAGLEVLLEAGRQKIAARQGQGLLDLESPEPAPGWIVLGVVEGLNPWKDEDHARTREAPR